MKRKIFITCLFFSLSFLSSSKASADTTPDRFTINDISAVPMNMLIDSDQVTVSGIDAPTTISISGGSYSINNGDFTNQGKTVSNGDKITVELLSAATPSTQTKATLTIGDISDDFIITTDSVDLTPDQFGFMPKVDVATNTLIESDPITVSGLADKTDIWSENAEYSINNGPFTSQKGTVSNGDVVTLRATSAPTHSTTTSSKLYIHYVWGIFNVTTSSGSIITPFNFDPVTNVPLDTTIDSNEITIGGLDIPFAAVLISNGMYSKNGAAFTSQGGTVSNGDKIIVRQTSSNSFSTTTTTTLTVEGYSADFKITTLAADTTPDAFAFTPITDAELNTDISSNEVTVTGINAPTSISITNGQYSISGLPFTSNTGLINSGEKVVVKLKSAATSLTKSSAALTIGDITSTFDVTTKATDVDTTPDQFSFTPKTDVSLFEYYESDRITITGMNAPAPISITGGVYLINDGQYTTNDGLINDGDSIMVRVYTLGSPLTKYSAKVTIGGVSANFDVTTRDEDTTPDPFTFAPKIDVALNSPIESDPITISGVQNTVQVSIVGGEYSIDGKAFTSNPGAAYNNNKIVVRQTSSSNPLTKTTATLTVGTFSAAFDVTTKATDIDTTPNPFAFTAKTGAFTQEFYESDPVAITGINAPAPISFSGNGQYLINNGIYTTSDSTINNGDTITIRVHTSQLPLTKTSATITVGGVSASFDVTTGDFDVTPDAFTFTAKTNVELNSTVESNPISVSGLQIPAQISIVGGEYSTDGTTFTSANGFVYNTNQVIVRQTSSPNPLTKTTATLTIGTVSATFEVITKSVDVDTTPDPFIFTPLTDVYMGEMYESNRVTITGINTPTPISISNGQYLINNGLYTANDGTINNGDQVMVRIGSSANPLTKTSTTLTIGGVSAVFEITTRGDDITPDPFTFTPKTDVLPNTLVESETVTITGINAPTPILIVGGEYSIDGTDFTSKQGAVHNGNQVKVRQTSSSNPITKTSTTLTIGTVNATFDVTTISGDSTPNQFSFDPQLNIPLNTKIDSNEITVSGIDVPVPISIIGGTYSINGSAFQSSQASVLNGDKVIVRQTSSSSPLTKTTATLTIGTISANFDVTTLDVDVTPDPFSFKDRADVPLKTSIESDQITISGISAPAPISIKNGEYSIDGESFTSADGFVNDGNKITIRIMSSPEYLTKTTASVSVGNFNSEFSVTTIKAPENVAPVIKPIPDQNAVLNELFSYEVKANDANGDKITYSLGSDCPPEMKIDSETGVITWTPSELGIFDCTVTVSDGSLSDSGKFKVTVTEILIPAPVQENDEDKKDNAGDNCDVKCERFHEYRRKYKNSDYKELYFKMKDWDETNPAEYRRLEAIYLKYKKLSQNEISMLPENIQADFKTFRHFNGYKHYRHLRDDR